MLSGRIVDFDILRGKIFKKIEVKNNEILFYTADGTFYKMHHLQDCCESVVIEDICGDIQALCDEEILVAEERTSSENPKPDSDESFTWTFYFLRTSKHEVTIRWYGESNGYYSEGVTLMELHEHQERSG